MIEEFIEPETKGQVIDFYDKISNNDFTVEYLQNSLVMIGKVILRILPRAKPGTVYVTSRIEILAEDILEMDSISEEEKEESIFELVERNKKELLDLTKQVIDKIESDLIEAKNNGYCSKLLQEFNIQGSNG